MEEIELLKDLNHPNIVSFEEGGRRREEREGERARPTGCFTQGGDGPREGFTANPCLVMASQLKLWEWFECSSFPPSPCRVVGLLELRFADSSRCFVSRCSARDRFYFSFELAVGGELFTRIVAKGRFSEDKSQEVVRFVVVSLSPPFPR